jgi:DNA-nicking Smr family endonuclease
MSENNPDDEDDLIWRGYAAKLKPLSKRNPKKIPAPKPVPERHSPAPDPAPKTPRLPTPDARPPLRFERRREKQLREGDIRIDAKLDLHGMTQDAAYAALQKFITKHQKLGHRQLLVITGKGSSGGGAGKTGVLRKNFTNWLENLCERSFILGLRPAAPKHGGDGAFYVLLRKTR